jgi:hypothetical protein
MSPTKDAASGEELFLNLLCTRVGDAWRVYARPLRMPDELRRCFDEHYEAYPAILDFEDLDRHMELRGFASEAREWSLEPLQLRDYPTFDRRVTKLGDVELTARGQGATELAAWLSSALTNCIH